MWTLYVYARVGCRTKIASNVESRGYCFNNVSIKTREDLISMKTEAKTTRDRDCGRCKAEFCNIRWSRSRPMEMKMKHCEFESNSTTNDILHFLNCLCDPMFSIISPNRKASDIQQSQSKLAGNSRCRKEPLATFWALFTTSKEARPEPFRRSCPANYLPFIRSPSIIPNFAGRIHFTRSFESWIFMVFLWFVHCAYQAATIPVLTKKTF